jgi:predicted ATPase/DNA-binding NarL/FixJ family response regulator
VSELRELEALIAQSRLLTLLGPGGAGKTRLALELATRGRTAYPDGAWLAELAPLTDGSLVAQTVATALGIREQSGQAVLETVAETLGNQRALLVLDNCEHVIAASAELAEFVLRRCPQLTVLATSREAFELSGEVIFRVGELSLPKSTDSPNRAELLRSEAVRLFVERARAVAPAFELTPENSAQVAGVCVRLDGNPLAIELAARRVRLLPVGTILDRLDDRFGLLTTGVRTAAHRHQDLRTAIDWSYELLEKEEQAAFRRLSVLVGGFTLETAAAVCAGDEVPPDAMLDLIASLDSKSLIVPEHRTPGGRFRQLESIRLYGRDQLAAAGELDATYERLVNWLLELVKPTIGEAMLHSGDQLEPILAERDTLLHAIEWAAERGDGRQMLLAAALARSWMRDGYYTEGRRLLRTALDNTDPAYPGRSAGLAHAATLAAYQGDQVEALELLTEALELERSGERPLMLYRVLNAFSTAYLCMGDQKPAADFARQAVEVLRPLGRALDTSVAIQNHAWSLVELGDFEQASVLMTECIALYQRHTSEPLPPEWLHTAGALALGRGDDATAEARFREGLLQLPSQVEGRTAVIYLDLVEGLAIIAARRGQPQRALRLAAATDAARHSLRAYLGGAERRPLDEAMTSARAALSPAAVRAAEEGGRKLNAAQTIAYALDDAWPDPSGPDSGADVLTPRERAVACLVVEGLTNRQIAGRLRVSERTVEAHLEHIRTKLDLRSRAQIAGWAVENSITAPQ